MKIQLAFAALIVVAMIACTQDTTPVTRVNSAKLEPIGFGTITFVDDTRGQPTLNLKTKALYGYNSNFIDLKRITVNSFTVGARPPALNGYRYVSFTYAVRNANAPLGSNLSGTGVPSNFDRSNLTFVPVSISSGSGTTLNSPLTTPISALGKFNGAVASSSIAPEVQPTHGSRFNPFTGLAQVNDDQADLQVFTEAETTTLKSSTASWPSTHTPFPYGFVVRNKYNTSNRTLGSNPPVGQFDGVVTFGFKVPLQPNVTDDPFVYSVQFVITQDNTARVTKSNEEVSATRAQAEATALGGSLVQDSSVCNVRYAGVAGSTATKNLNGFGAKGASLLVLDSCFGVYGRTQLDLGYFDSGNATVLQPDGKILVAGSTQSLEVGFDFLLARFDPTGTLDLSFGIGGKSTLDFVGQGDDAYAIGLQPDGKIVLAGRVSTSNDSQAFGLARFNASGTLDSSFGNGGKTIVEFTGAFSVSEARALVLLPDGKILVAGNDSFGVGTFAVARLNANGMLDLSFGTGGKKVFNFLGLGAGVNAMAVQRDGKILLAGWAVTADSFPSDFGLVRLNPDGTLDSGFGVAGLTYVNFGLEDVAYAIALQSDGKILLAGQARALSGVRTFGMVRFSANGVLDPSFGTDGMVTHSIGIDSFATSIALQPDGKILLGGQRTVIAGQNSLFSLLRFNPNGALDSSFTNNFGLGFLIGGQPAETNVINAVAVQLDGRILAVGTADTYSSGTTGVDIALARYNP